MTEKEPKYPDDFFIKPNDVVITKDGRCLNVGESIIASKEDPFAIFDNRVALIPKELITRLGEAIPTLQAVVQRKFDAQSQHPPPDDDALEQEFHRLNLSGLKFFGEQLSEADAGDKLIVAAKAAANRCRADTAPHFRELLRREFDREDGAFTDTLRTLFTHTPATIITVNEFRKIYKQVPRNVHYAAAQSGRFVVIDHEMAKEVGSRKIEDFCTMLMDVAGKITGLSLEQPASRKLSEELVLFGWRPEYYGKTISPQLNERQILGTMHTWLHDGKHSEKKLRQDFPSCMRFYDEKMELFRKKATAMEAEALERQSLRQAATSAPADAPAGLPLSADAEGLIATVRDFVKSKLGEEPPYTLFRCHLRPSVHDLNPIDITMSRWRQEPEGLKTESSSLALKTNEPDFEKALHLKQLVQCDILNMPGIMPFRRIVGGRIVIDDDDTVPLSATSNSAKHDIVKQNGVFRLHIECREGRYPADVFFTLGLRQSEDMRAEAERRAEFILNRLRRLHEKKPPMHTTRGDLSRELRKQVGLANWQNAEQLDLTEMPHTIDVAYPDKEKFSQRTQLLVDIPYKAGTPTESWKLPVRIMVDGNCIKTQHFNLHALDPEVAAERVRRVVDNLKSGLEEQNTSSRWHLDNNARLMTLQTGAALGSSPDMDSVRLEDICTDAERHVADRRLVMHHQVAVVAEQPLESGRVAVRLAVRRQHSGQPVEEYFMESLPGSKAPVRVERSVMLPPGADVHAASARLQAAVDDVFQKGMYRLYATRTDSGYEKDGIPKRRTPLEFNQRTLPNLLEASISAALQHNIVPGADMGFDYRQPEDNQSIYLRWEAEKGQGNGGKSAHRDRASVPPRKETGLQ